MVFIHMYNIYAELLGTSGGGWGYPYPYYDIRLLVKIGAEGRKERCETDATMPMWDSNYFKKRIVSLKWFLVFYSRKRGIERRYGERRKKRKRGAAAAERMRNGAMQQYRAQSAPLSMPCLPKHPTLD